MMSNTNDEQGRYIRLGTGTKGNFTPDQQAIDAGFTFTLKNDMERKDYIGEQPKREPLLALEQINDWSDEFMDGIRLPNGPNLGEIQDAFITGADKVDGFYRTLITEGRLMVVSVGRWKMVSPFMGGMAERSSEWVHDGCSVATGLHQTRVYGAGYPPNDKPKAAFCPDCGAQIAEA